MTSGTLPYISDTTGYNSANSNNQQRIFHVNIVQHTIRNMLSSGQWSKLYFKNT